MMNKNSHEAFRIDGSSSSLIGAGSHINLLNTTTCAYLVSPANHIGKVYIGVLLIPDMYGHLTKYSIGYADKIAEQGYVVIVPDIYRNHPVSPTVARFSPSSETDSMNDEIYTKKTNQIKKQLTFENILEDISNSIQVLRTIYGIQKISCVGCGWGGEVALRCSSMDSMLFSCCIVLSPTGSGRTLGRQSDGLQNEYSFKCPTLIILGDREKYVLPDEVDQLNSTCSKDIPFRIKVFHQQGHGFAFSHIIDEDAATQAISEILDWIVMFSLDFKPALCTSDGEPWWPQGKNGPFVNAGLKKWHEIRDDWRKQTRPRPPPPPPIRIDSFMEDLTLENRPFELPHPMRLGDLVEVLVEIWDVNM